MFTKNPHNFEIRPQLAQASEVCWYLQVLLQSCMIMQITANLPNSSFFFLSTLQVIHVYQANTNNMHLKYDAKKRIFDNLGGKILKRYLKCSVPFFFIKTKFLWKSSERSPLKSMAIKSKTHFRTNINHGERLYIQRGYSARHPSAKKNKLGSPLKKSVGDSKNHF